MCEGSGAALQRCSGAAEQRCSGAAERVAQEPGCRCCLWSLSWRSGAEEEVKVRAVTSVASGTAAAVSTHSYGWLHATPLGPEALLMLPLIP